MDATIGQTYTVRFTGPRLSGKRFSDAVKLVKKAGGTYDAASKTWTVTPADVHDVSSLHYLAASYDAAVEQA